MKKTRTTPLHPQSDGLVERFNYTLTTQLAILASTHQRDWDEHLAFVLWSYRTAVHESTGCTPALLMFGRELRTPVDLVFGAPPEPEIEGGNSMEYARRLRGRLRVVHDLARAAQGEAAAKQKRAYDTRSNRKDFVAGDQVWVHCPVRKKGLSPKLCSHWQGPCEVLHKVSDVVYKVRMCGRRHRMVVLHRDRLAPYHALVRPQATAGEATPEDTSSSSPALTQSSPAAHVMGDHVAPPPIPSLSPATSLLHTPTPPGRPQRQHRLPAALRDFVCGLWESPGTADSLGGGSVAAEEDSAFPDSERLATGP